MLQIYADYNITSGIVEAACTDSNQIYCCTNVPDYRLISWSGFQNNSSLSLSATPTGIALANASPASAVISYSSARLSIVDSNNNKLDITTNALATYTTAWGQQISGSTASGFTLSTSSTAGKICKTTLSSQTVSQLSPTPLSGIHATCITPRPDTNNWLVGTDSGTVFEMDSSGNQVGSTLSIAKSPGYSVPTLQITGLSYYNNNLCVVTDHGDILTYTWPGQVFNTSLLNASNSFGSNGSNGCISDSASGTCLVFSGGSQSPNSTNAVTEMFFNTVSGGIPNRISYYNEALIGALSGGIQASVASSDLSHAWAIFPNSVTQGIQLRLYYISNPTPTTETTRFQFPSGTDVASRCIRIRDDGPGRETIEVDQNVSSGSQSVLCSQGKNYIELNIYNNSGTNEWDVREFST